MCRHETAGEAVFEQQGIDAPTQPAFICRDLQQSQDDDHTGDDDPRHPTRVLMPSKQQQRHPAEGKFDSRHGIHRHAIGLQDALEEGDFEHPAGQHHAADADQEGADGKGQDAQQAQVQWVEVLRAQQAAVHGQFLREQTAASFACTTRPMPSKRAAVRISRFSDSARAEVRW